jgi:tRNA pseudouridine13 synthase
MSVKLHFPYGITTISGQIKSQPEDFKVTEALGFLPTGEGEHLLLQVEKVMLTTHELIDKLASDFSIKPREVGYCGLKDKHAVTRQWISLHLPGQLNRVKIPEKSDYKILAQAWHNKKLRPGSHRSNFFEVVLRNVTSLPESTSQQIELIRCHGMANYFGEQRFGHKGSNFDQALRVFGNARRTRKLSRSKRSLYLSALRSFLFNQVLSKRIEQGIWEAPLSGDVFMLSGTHSIFFELITDEILERYQHQDISSTVSLYGTGDRMLQDKSLEIEDQVFAEFESVKQCLIEQKVKLQMRSTRVAVAGLKIEFDQRKDQLYIEASLPPGSFFTSLLDHFVDTGNR